MPPDPPRSSALRASLLPLRGNYISHSILTKNLGIYVTGADWKQTLDEINWFYDFYYDIFCVILYNYTEENWTELIRGIMCPFIK